MFGYFKKCYNFSKIVHFQKNVLMFLKLFTYSKKWVHKFLKCSHLLFIFTFFRFQRCSNFKKFVHKFESDHNFQILFTISNNVLVFNFVPFLFTKTVCAFENLFPLSNFCSQNSIKVWIFFSKTPKMFGYFKKCYNFSKIVHFQKNVLMFLKLFTYSKKWVHKFLKCSHLLFIFTFFRFQRCSNFKKFVHKFESDHNFQILFTISNNVLVFNFVPFLFTKTVCAFEICSHYQFFVLKIL